MIKRRRILYADKIIQNVVHVFCLLMFLQLKGTSTFILVRRYSSSFFVGYFANFNFFTGFYSHISNPILLYSTEIDIRAANIESYDFNKHMRFTTIIKDLVQGTAVDFLYRKNLVCWSDQTAVIQCTNFNGTAAGEKVKLYSYYCNHTFKIVS